MLRKLCDISNISANNLVGRKMTVIEKLDMVYFKIGFFKDGVQVMKTPSFRKITDVDMLCNDMYKDMAESAMFLYEKHGSEIVDKYGDGIVIGLFYLPANKAKVISYPSLAEYSYIYSDCNRSGFDFMCISDLVMDRPVIADEVEFTKEMLELRNDPLAFTKLVTGGYSWSGNNIEDIEGIVLEFSNSKLQVIVNDCDIPVDKFTTKTYRDVILNDFANTVLIGEADFVRELVEMDVDYIGLICRAFCEYMHMTDIFSRQDISADDLIPPHNGYFGNISVEDIPYDTAKLMCKYDARAANILRILLYAFNRKSDFGSFNERQSEALKNFFKSITNS